ncbi:MAG: hypothetical protein KME59_21385 [Trichormus sp. ATA11-4-KO1]|jgi:hypothetical protein|nr:hypothetical protein [Trichormus sp. ATA11-4-KO1]
MLNPISQKQAIITISDISGVYWKALNGGKVAREKIKYNDGKQGIEQTFVGFLSLEDLTVMKNFDPKEDGVVINWVEQQVANPTPFNVAIQPVKSDLVGSPFDGAKQILYSNCQLADYKYPTWDRESSGLAVFELVLIFNSLPTYQ